MVVPHKQKEVLLKGITPKILKCEEISSRKLTHMEKLQVVWYCFMLNPLLSKKVVECPEEMQTLLKQFSDLCEEPKGLPPQRKFDHTIPLIPGAQPVNVRQSRYNPEQKDEIERHIAETIKNGIIQKSFSPFSSPLLLVAKKDLTWRLCTDFRHLNAITVKNRYPIPIVEELLEELQGAIFVTSLDLGSRYHQICMK
jgi:hypothetical protein